MVITPAGFQFLLLDTASQVWHFMLQYLETAEVYGFILTCVFQRSKFVGNLLISQNFARFCPVRKIGNYTFSGNLGAKLLEQSFQILNAKLMCRITVRNYSLSV